jgi:serine/threonine protein kinase
MSDASSQPNGSNPIADLKIGDRLGRFRVTGKLGRGSMGWVVRAQDITLKRAVALKLVPYKSDDEQQRTFGEQFIREARASAQLIHPGIVQIFEVGVDKGMIFIAMEILEGGTLEDIVGKDGAMDWQRAVKLCIQSADGLAYAHERGIVHRDIKPANIMLADSGHCKVTDFGLAHFDQAHGESDSPWKVVGTPLYMAPEAAKAKADARSDVFSLAGVLWFLLTGKPPFEIKHLADVLRVGKDIPLTPMRQLRQDLPPKLTKLLETALSHDAAFRHQSADDFGNDLRQLLVAEDVAAAKPKANRKPLWIGLTAALIAAIGVGVYFATRGEDPPPKPNPTALNPPQPGDNGQDPKDPTDPPHGATAIPPGGQSVLAAKPLESVQAMLGQDDQALGVFSFITAAHPALSQAGRVVVNTAPAEPNMAKLRVPIEGEIFAGHVYLLSFWIRGEPTERGDGIVHAYVRRARAPNQPLAIAHAPAKTQWQRIDVPFVAGFSLPKGFAELEFHVGQRVQTIDLADIRLLSYANRERIAAMPRSDLPLLDASPKAEPKPLDVFGAVAVASDAIRIGRMASSNDPRTYLFAGHVKDTPSSVTSKVTVPLDANARGLVALIDRDPAREVYRAAGVQNAAGLVNRRLVVIGEVEWSNELERPAIMVDDASRVRVVSLLQGKLRATDRQALIDAALYKHPVVIADTPASISFNKTQADVAFSKTPAPGDLRLRYAAKLFGAMSRKFGGADGSLVVDQAIELRGTPTYDPTADTLVLNLARIEDISKPTATTNNNTTSTPHKLAARAARLVIERSAAEQPSAVRLDQTIKKPVKQGTPFTLRLWARANLDKANVHIYVSQTGGSWKADVREGPTLTKKWQQLTITGTTKMDHPAGKWRVAIYPAIAEKVQVDITSVDLRAEGIAGNLIENGDFSKSFNGWKWTRNRTSKALAIKSSQAIKPGPAQVMAMRLESPGNSSDFGLVQDMQADVRPNQRIKLRMFARRVSGPGVVYLGPAVKGVTKLTGSELHRFELTSTWAPYEVLVRVPKAGFKSGRWQIALLAGRPKQQVDIACIEVQLVGSEEVLNQNSRFSALTANWTLLGPATQVRPVKLIEPNITGVATAGPIDLIESTDRARTRAALAEKLPYTFIVTGQVERRPQRLRDKSLMVVMRGGFVVVLPQPQADAIARNFGTDAKDLLGKKIRVKGPITEYRRGVPQIKIKRGGDLKVVGP